MSKPTPAAFSGLVDRAKAKAATPPASAPAAGAAYTTISIRVPATAAPLWAAMKKQAIEERRPVAALAVDAIEAYLADHDALKQP
jgi:hypothetical protein